jgi:putative nucleotidyltransferase with HDIG domain
MENVRAYDELEQAQLETLQRLALAAEFRDDATYEHTERVAHTAATLAERLGLPAGEVALIRRAAPLHDIGKLAVPDAILLKPDRLTAREFETMKRHAPAGAAILDGSRSAVLRLAREIALTHHEWWSGSGYPAGLAGDDCPLSGRIVALADVFDALVHERPYKPAWTVDRAASEIRAHAGRQFDPDVVAAFEAAGPATLVAGPM